MAMPGGSSQAGPTEQSLGGCQPSVSMAMSSSQNPLGAMMAGQMAAAQLNSSSMMQGQMSGQLPSMQQNGKPGRPQQPPPLQSLVQQLAMMVASSSSMTSVATGNPSPQVTPGTPCTPTTPTTPTSANYIRNGDHYVCTLCGKTVVSKAAITRHIQLTHEKRKPFECSICHRRFGYKNILLEHQNIHFGIKPYACNLCDKRFAARSNLFQHKLLHQKPYSCQVCNRRFDRMEQWERHLQTHPNQTLLSCNLCSFRSSNQEALSEHTKRNHQLQIYDTRYRFHSGSNSSDFSDLPIASMVGGVASPSGMPSHGKMATSSMTGSRTSVSMAMAQMGMMLPVSHSNDGGGSGGGGLQGAGGAGNANTPEMEAMRKIDTICSQLASRNSMDGMGFLKQEPSSPSRDSSGRIQFCNANPNYDQSSSPSNVFPSPSLSYGGPVFPGVMPQGLAGNGKDDMSNLDSVGSQERGDNSNLSTSPSMSPSLVIDESGSQASGVIHSTAKSMCMPSTSHANYSHTRSTADSTSGVSEVLSTLQLLVQKAQDLPELTLTIGKPKLSQDAATQHTSEIEGLTSLQDFLWYFESRGKLYRCPHCRIIFEERGMFFLHKSLHGENSPWECSICHKVCSDKNDFNLHFVNEQHTGM